MSDAFTDVPDQSQIQKIRDYYEALLQYLLNEITLEELMGTAQQSDKDSGNWAERTDFSGKEQSQLVKLLREGNVYIWAEFLFKLRDTDLYTRFKKLSPFKGKLVLKVRQNRDGTVEIHGPDVLRFVRYEANTGGDIIITIDDAVLSSVERL